MDHPRSREEAERLVRESENRFVCSLREAVRWVLADAGRTALTISGPSCSGKTTAAARLRAELTGCGRHIVPFSFDDFFKDTPRDNAISGTPPDYDTVHVLDLAYLAETVETLAQNRPAQIPIYDFVAGKRAGYRMHTPVPGEIRVWEGIQAAYPEVLHLLGKEAPDIVLETVPPDVWGIAGCDLRLCRRILRDRRCRGATPAFTLFLWKSVRENERRNMEACLSEAKIRINSCMAYEPYILAQYLLPVLVGIREESPVSEEAGRLAGLLEGYRNDMFETRMIPRDSVFREFIGEA